MENKMKKLLLTICAGAVIMIACSGAAKTGQEANSSKNFNDVKGKVWQLAEVRTAGGKVTFDDGSPVTQGGVVFETDSFMAEGRIQSDGSYTLSSLKPGDGLPAGSYRVTISSMEMGDNYQPIYYVDPKFSNSATSGLTADVAKGKNRFDFTVTKP